MSRYTNYYRGKSNATATAALHGTDTSVPRATIEASTSRDKAQLIEDQEKWEEWMSKVFTDEQIVRILAVRSQLDFEEYFFQLH